MRQLNPQVVQDRKRKLLQWVIHSYIRNSRPIASQDISEEADMVRRREGSGVGVEHERPRGDQVVARTVAVIVNR